MQAKLQQELSRRYRFRVSPLVREKLGSLPYAQKAALIRQFYPSSLELYEHPSFNIDPLHEEDKDIHPAPFLIHKYPSKLLLLATRECPVYCRYCTRKRKTLSNGISDRTEPESEVDIEFLESYLIKNPKINEVILSGGDPLMLSTPRLRQIAEACLEKQSISFLRYHTRVATTLPSRFSEKLFDVLKQLKKSYPSKIQTFVFHINTPQELSDEFLEIVGRLKSLGFPLFSQSVLLKRVNDKTGILALLFRRLFEHGVQPYYLHQLDKIEGSVHFYVPVTKGLHIMGELREHLPPYMLPSYVQDSKSGKQVI